MELYEKIIERKEKISLVGLGYVGMPIAVAFSEKADVIGFDLNKEKIKKYKNGIDPTGEIGSIGLRNSKVLFTSEEKELKNAKFHIIAVPTPINLDKSPNLEPIESASKIIGRNLVKGSIVVYESTVYPGATEDICIPILEEESGMKCGIDFKVGYSPERINPGDKIHTLDKIVKIVSGIDMESLEEIAKIYELVINAGVHKASSIKVAEAAKVVENSQRDINIAFMNELAIAFDKMEIDTNEVIDAMNTKWNSLGFRPGLVGGHCIGVDPYYFIYQAENLGYTSQIISSGRKINDSIGGIIADAIIKQLVLTGKAVRNSSVVIFGLTFKENCPDLRNSKVVDIIKRLKEYGINPKVVDPLAEPEEAKREYQIELTRIEDLKNEDALVFAVAHDQFLDLSLDRICNMYKDKKVLIDVKNIFKKTELELFGVQYWKL